MPEPEEEPHAYGVCQSCGGSLRFPLRGTGTTIACPHCLGPTILQVGTDDVRAKAVLPPTLPKKPPIRRKPATAGFRIASVMLGLAGAGMVFFGCGGTVMDATRTEQSLFREIHYALQYGFGFTLLALSLILYALADVLSDRD